MKCAACKTFVTNIPVNWKCPHCGEQLQEPGALFKFQEGMIEYLQDKGAIFWGIFFGVLLLFIGILEMVFSYGFLMAYITGNVLLSLVMIFFGGMLIDMYVKVVLPLRLPYRSDFILRERAVIRNIRKATHIAAVAGLGVCVVWLKPRTFLLSFPSYLIVIGWFLALTWAAFGLFLEGRMADDIRFRAYMERLGIISLKRFRKIGTVMIATLVLIAITFYILIHIPDLWIKFKNWGLVGVVIHFISTYLSWLF